MPTALCLVIGDIGYRILCSLDKLLNLANRKCSVADCDGHYKISYKIIGCCLQIFGTCGNRHQFFWESSSSLLNQQNSSKIYQDNLRFGAAIILSGNNYGKLQLFCRFLGVPVISKSTFHAYQRTIICPAIHEFYANKKVSDTF